MSDIPPEYDSAKIHDKVYTVEDCERHRRELEKATRRRTDPKNSSSTPGRARS